MVLSEGPGANNNELGFSDVIIIEIAVSEDPIFKKKKKEFTKLLNIVDCIKFDAGLYFFSFHIFNPISPKSLLYKVFLIEFDQNSALNNLSIQI